MRNALDDENGGRSAPSGHWAGRSPHPGGTGIRRETISGYLKAAEIAVRSRGRPSESKPKPAISEAVSTDSAPVLESGIASTSFAAREPSRLAVREGMQPGSRGEVIFRLVFVAGRVTHEPDGRNVIFVGRLP